MSGLFNKGMRSEYDDEPAAPDTQLIVLDDKSPTGIKGVDSARLPEAYKRFKQELAACLRIDDAKQWASQAEALAAWSRMCGDRDVERMWKGFRQLAQRRYGELRKLVAPRGGDHKSQRFRRFQNQNKNPPFDRQASAFAQVPKETFEAEVEKGATDHQLTMLGREAAAKQRAKARKADNEKLPPSHPASPQQKAATKLLVLVERTRNEGKAINFEHALAGMTEAERTKFVKDCTAIAEWYRGMAERASNEQAPLVAMLIETPRGHVPRREDRKAARA